MCIFFINFIKLKLITKILFFRSFIINFINLSLNIIIIQGLRENITLIFKKYFIIIYF